MTRNQRVASKLLQSGRTIPLDLAARLMREGVIMDTFERKEAA